jgi:hypothetical protein
LMHSMRACGWRVAMRRACTKRMHWNQFQTGAQARLRQVALFCSHFSRAVVSEFRSLFGDIVFRSLSADHPRCLLVGPRAFKARRRAQMPLTGRIAAAPPGVHGFDANSVLDGRVCKVARARGFEFCIRYISRQDVQPVRDLSEAEANVILGAGWP